MSPEQKALPATLTVEAAGKIMGISRASAYQAVRDGTIPSIRLGRRVVVPTARLLKMLGLDPESAAVTLAGSQVGAA